MKEKEDRLPSLAYSSLRKRVAKGLVDIYMKFSENGQGNPIEISREDIAHYVGTATESLIRTLSDFKSEKLITIQEGKIHSSNLEKLTPAACLEDIVLEHDPKSAKRFSEKIMLKQ